MLRDWFLSSCVHVLGSSSILRVCIFSFCVHVTGTSVILRECLLFSCVYVSGASGSNKNFISTLYSILI